MAIGKLNGHVIAIRKALSRRIAKLGSFVKKKVIIKESTAPIR